MKKIVILSNEIGIIYKFRFELLKELVKNKKVFLLSPKTDKQEFFLEEIMKLGVNFIEIKLNRRKFNIFQEIYVLIQYYRKLKELNPDKVLTYTIKPNIYGGIICRVLNLKYISTVTGVGSAFQKENLLKKIVVFFNRIALKNAEKIFFQNEINLNIYLKEKIIKIENTKIVNGSGVNLEKFNCEIKKLNFPIEILFIGRIMQEKGIEEFLEVAKRIKEKYKEKIEFKILGQYEEDKYEDMIKNLQNQGIVKYLGISNDVRNELKDVHCLINPSWHEGMSNVLLESGAMKRFLIASDIPGCREIVINNKTGFIFEKQNIDDLENKIEQFINLSEEEYEKYINSSYEHIKNNFDRKIVIEEYLKIINS